jgi:competence protein ComEC
MANTDAQHTTVHSASPLKRPLALPAAALALGILTAEYYPLTPGLTLSAGAVSIAVLILRRHSFRTITVLVFVSVFLLGAARYAQYTTIDPTDVSRVATFRYSTVEGVVDADPEIRGQSARMIVGVSAVKLGNRWIRATGNVQVSQYLAQGERMALPKYGDRVIFHGRITSPAEPNNPGGFSYREYLARGRIYAVAQLKDRDDLGITGRGRHNPALALAGRVRDHISASLGRQMPEPESGIAAGMALGTYSTLPDEIFDNFQRTGTLHLLAASGFNCAIIVFCMLFVFRRLHLPKRWAYTAAIPTLILYMLIVGTKPSIVRATIMASLLALAYVLRRISDPLNILFAAALVILAWTPTDLFDVGFELSFAAVLAIILAIPAIKPWVERIASPTMSRPRSRVERATRWIGGNLTEAVCATIAATLGTLPITAQCFNQVSLVSIPVNAAVAMLASPVLILSLIAPVVAGIPMVGQAVASADVAVIRVMLSVVNGFGSLSWSSISIGSPGPFSSTGYYVIVGVAVAHLSRQAHKAN